MIEVLFVGSGIACRGTICYLVAKGYSFYVIKEAWFDGRLYNELHFMKFIMKHEAASQKKIPNIPTYFHGGDVKVKDRLDAQVEIIDSTRRNRPDECTYIAHDRTRCRLVLRPIGRTIEDFSSIEEILSALLDVVIGKLEQYLI